MEHRETTTNILSKQSVFSATNEPFQRSAIQSKTSVLAFAQQAKMYVGRIGSAP